MVMRGLKAARLRQKETINYIISVFLALTLLHIYVLFLTGRNKSKPICSQLMSKCNYSNARKKITQKEKAKNVDGSRFCVLCVDRYRKLQICCYKTPKLLPLSDHTYTQKILSNFCVRYVSSFLSNKINLTDFILSLFQS